MLASQLAKKHGKKLIGRKVYTCEYGEWPGGVATVVQVGNKTAPEIVFFVKASFWKGEMGVFDHEEVSLVH